jgi:hypothetical protein
VLAKALILHLGYYQLSSCHASFSYVIWMNSKVCKVLGSLDIAESFEGCQKVFSLIHKLHIFEWPETNWWSFPLLWKCFLILDHHLYEASKCIWRSTFIHLFYLSHNFPLLIFVHLLGKTWHRTVEEEALFVGKRRKEVKNLAKNQTRWRCFVDALCSSGN